MSALLIAAAVTAYLVGAYGWVLASVASLGDDPPPRSQVELHICALLLIVGALLWPVSAVLAYAHYFRTRRTP